MGVYFSNSLVKSMEMTAAQSFGSPDYYNISLMTILGLAGVLFCENEQT